MTTRTPSLPDISGIDSSASSAGVLVPQTIVTPSGGTNRPERFIYDPNLKVMENILRGVAFASLDYPDMRFDEIRNVLNKCRAAVIKTIQGKPVPKCGYKEGRLAGYRQGMANCEGCMTAHREAERQEGGNGFAPVSAYMLVYALRPARRRSYSGLPGKEGQSYPRQLQERYYPDYSPDWYPGPEDAMNLEISSQRAWALLGHREKQAHAPFGGCLSVYSPPEQLASAFGLKAPNITANYRLRRETKIMALMQRDEACEPFFQPVWWMGDSGLYDGKCYGRHVLRKRPVYRRCLIPMDGFFVWEADALYIPVEQVQRYCLRPESPDTLFAVAALQDPSYSLEDGSCSPTVVLLTIPAPPLMQGKEQDCLPMALPQSEWKRWLEPGPLTKDDVEAMARSCANVRMQFRPVGEYFHQYQSNDERCILSEEEILTRGWKVEPGSPAETPKAVNDDDDRELVKLREASFRRSSGSRPTPSLLDFNGFISSCPPPEELAAAFGREVPNVAVNDRSNFDAELWAIMQEDGADDAFFRMVRWHVRSGSYDRSRYGRYARRRSIHRRCLLSIGSVLVWRRNPTQHYCLRPESPDTAFVVAAIMDPHCKAKNGPDNHTVALMTMPAPPLMQGLEQTCLPMILPPSAWKRWIEPGKLTKDDVEEMACSSAQVKMSMQPVGG